MHGHNEPTCMKFAGAWNHFGWANVLRPLHPAASHVRRCRSRACACPCRATAGPPFFHPSAQVLATCAEVANTIDLSTADEGLLTPTELAAISGRCGSGSGTATDGESGQSARPACLLA